MGFNSAFKGLKLLKNPGNGRLNNLNDPNRPQCVNSIKNDVLDWNTLAFINLKFVLQYSKPGHRLTNTVLYLQLQTF